MAQRRRRRPHQQLHSLEPLFICSRAVLTTCLHCAPRSRIGADPSYGLIDRKCLTLATEPPAPDTPPQSCLTQGATPPGHCRWLPVEQPLFRMQANPPSPCLTNPDMILPSYDPSHSSTRSSYLESQPPPSLPWASSPTWQDEFDLERRSDASFDDFEIPRWEDLGSATVDDFPSPVGSPFPEEEEGSLSHAALTKRAERILANAKTRLTVRRMYCCTSEPAS